MLQLLKIEWLKNKKYRTFWVIIVLYIGLTGIVYQSGKLVSDFINGKNEQLDKFSNALPIYSFPDIWHNIAWTAGLFKFILAFYVIISITNEFNYRTIRQNVIDGLSRTEFMLSKILLLLLLSLISGIFIFLVGFWLGMNNSDAKAFKYIFEYIEFIPAFILESFMFFSFALFFGILIRKAGLGMLLLLLYAYIAEPIFVLQLPDWLKWLGEYFPMEVMRNLIDLPFKKYLFQEVQDYVALKDVLLCIIYSSITLWFSHLLIKRKDL